MVNDVHPGMTGSGAGVLSSPGLSSSSSKQSDSSGAPLRRERDETNEEDDGDNVSSSASACTSTSVTNHAAHARPLISERHDNDHTNGDLLASRKRKRVFMSVSETSVSSSGSEENVRTRGIAPTGGAERIMAARPGGLSNSHSLSLRSTQEKEDDLTTVEGQLRRNPHMSEEEARLAAKREYNRRNAARARSRNKSLMQELQEKVSKLNRLTEELQRTNDILRAQLELLSKQNETLMAEAAAASSPAASDVPSPQQVQPASLLNSSVPTAPLQAPPSQAQSLLNAVGLFSQLLQLQSLMNQAQQPQSQASQPPLQVQDQVSTPQVPVTPTMTSSAVATHGTTVTPSPTSRPPLDCLAGVTATSASASSPPNA